MNAVGIDVSKGKSMVAIMRPFGEVVAPPFEVNHTTSEFDKLVNFLKSLDGETKVVMEHTGKYSQPIARALNEAGIFVCLVNALLVHGYNNNSIRQVKTDKKDAIKIANYGLDRWMELKEYAPDNATRQLLKTYNRQCHQYMKVKVALKNNLISLLDQTFPKANTLFTNRPRKRDGHEKWVDFVARFWHIDCVCGLSESVFIERYNKWCKRHGYYSSDLKAKEIYSGTQEHIAMLPKNDVTKQLITLTVSQLNAISETLATIQREMNHLASQLPEYPVVMAMQGVGQVFGPQLMAEIGDVERFRRKQSLVAFAGIDAPPYQSGAFEAHSRSISKRGSPFLRKTLFQVMSCIMQSSSIDNEIFQYLDKKRSEGKHFYVYMMAGANKFLRIYYARVKEFLNDDDKLAETIH